MSHFSPKVFLLSVLSGPSETFEGQSVLLYALFLTVLLVVAVPVVALTTGVPALLLVVLAGLLYAAALLATESVFEGLCAAMFVLVTFAANVPLIELPIGGGGYANPQLEVMLVDVVAVPFAGLLSWWLYSGKISLSFGRERIAGYALVGFVGWSLLAALVANGPSRLAALFYVVVQLRSLLLFAIAAVVVKYIGIHSAVYSLGIAVLGQLAYAVAELLNRGSFGLTRLGDAPGSVPTRLFAIGPLQFESAIYAGGFIGTTRVLIAFLLLLVPVLVAIVVRHSTPWKLAAALALVASTVLVRVGRADSGWMAFLLTALLTVVALFALWLTADTDHTIRDGVFDYAAGIGSVIGAAALSVFLFSQRVVPNTSAGETGESVDAGGSSGGSSSAGGGADTGSDVVIQLLNYVPFINTTNLSIRLQQYVAAINIGLQYPLFGIGGMNFPFVAEAYGLPWPIAIHNAYLSVLASTGVPGMALFLLSIGAVLVIAGRMTLSPENDRLFWTMLVCGMLGFHAYLFWVTAYNSVAALGFWVLAGAVVGASQWSRQTGETGRSDSFAA
jgi:hypothetical protein